MLYVLLLDLNALFGLVLAGQLADAPGEAESLELDLVGDVLELLHQRFGFDQSVLAGEIVLVERVDPVLHVLQRTSCEFGKKPGSLLLLKNSKFLISNL